MSDIDDIRVLIYLTTGFLDSGKTEFLKFTLEQPYFQEKGRTVLLLCEDGENKFDEARLAKEHRTVIERIHSQDELTTEFLESLDQKYHPERVVIEYNGMWPVSKFESTPLPDGWAVIQKIATVDASTFPMYLTNMKPLFVEMVRNSDLVLFNRCVDRKALPGYRRGVKVVSPQAEVIFENNRVQITNIFDEDVPFDLKAPVIRVEREDYGIWYVDAMDKADRYKGKTVEFDVRAKRLKGITSAFIPGRMAMTCCENDLSFLGYPCRCRNMPLPPNGQWIRLRAKIGYEYSKKTDGPAPVLEAVSYEKCDPIEEYVYFN